MAAAHVGCSCGSMYHAVHPLLALTRNEYIVRKQKEWDTALEKHDKQIALRCAEKRATSSMKKEWLHNLPLPALSPFISLGERHRLFHEWALQAMTIHGLADSWQLAYDNGCVRAGACFHTSRTLSFSRHLIAKLSPKQWAEAILHEIAHALAGPEHGHDSTWQRICCAIGGTGKRCHDYTLAKPKWVLGCVAGCWKKASFRRSCLNRKPLCSRCHSPCRYQRVTTPTVVLPLC